MGCCEATNPDLTCDRRTALKAMLGVSGALVLGACRPRQSGDTATLRLAFCGQLLCVVPYEVARARGPAEGRCPFPPPPYSIPAAGFANSLLYNAVSVGTHSISRISKLEDCKRKGKIEAVQGLV